MTRISKRYWVLISVFWWAGCAPAKTDPIPLYEREMAAGTLPAMAPDTWVAGDCLAPFLTGGMGMAVEGFMLAARCEGDELLVDTNGVPNFEVSTQGGTTIGPRLKRYRFPMAPTHGESITSFEQEGVVGVALNGIPIMTPVDVMGSEMSDPVAGGTLDSCGGHTRSDGFYHLHLRPDCLLGEFEGRHDLVVGVAKDGFPIMAPFVCVDQACSSTKRVRSSWQVSAPGETNPFQRHTFTEGSGDLDRCNGLMGPDGVYRYYFTDEFPYILTCFRGQVDLETVQGSRLSVGG